LEIPAVIQQDPLLAELGAGDYHIPLTSPALGKGTDVPGGAVADYDPVAFAVPPSVGAFEAR
jgi:hypothetical protein